MAILLPRQTDADTPDVPLRWRAGEIVAIYESGQPLSRAESPEGGSVYNIEITDKTRDEVREYMQEWRHDPTTTQVSANGDDRLIQVVSSMISASGAAAFTTEQVDQFCADLNKTYPTANATPDTIISTGFRFNVTVPLSARDQLIREVNTFVADIYHRRRRWYINNAGMTFLANNGGIVTGTAAQLSQYLRDGLLD